MDESKQVGDVWTRGRVEARLIVAFKALPSHPVYSDHTRIRAVTGENRHVSSLSWTRLFVPNRDDALALLTWARCMAMGQSVSERYRDLGWPRPTAERARRRAIDQIVTGLKNGQTGLDSEIKQAGAIKAERESETVG